MSPCLDREFAVPAPEIAVPALEFAVLVGEFAVPASELGILVGELLSRQACSRRSNHEVLARPCRLAGRAIHV